MLSSGIFILILSITVVILIRNANRIIKYELESLLGKSFSVREIDSHWNKVQAYGIKYRNSGGKDILTADSLVIESDFRGFLKKEYIISSLSIESPYIFLETDSRGHLVNPFGGTKPDRKEKPVPAVLIKRLKLENGSVDYLDRKVSVTPVMTQLRDIEFESRKIVYPPDESFLRFSFTAKIPGNTGTGTIKSSGSIKLKTRDTDCRITATGLDITKFKPYFQKRGDVNVTRGFLDIDMNVKVLSGKIYAPGKAGLEDLQFETGQGPGKKFLSLPLSVVVSFLKGNNNRIAFDFVLEGDMDNPKFNLRESIVERMTLGIASKLGLSVTRIGESIVEFGVEGARQAGKGVEGIGKEIRRIFR